MAKENKVTQIWQKVMISWARNPRITRFMQTNTITSSLAKRFIAGSNVDTAITTAQSLMEEGFTDRKIIIQG